MFSLQRFEKNNEGQQSLSVSLLSRNRSSDNESKQVNANFFIHLTEGFGNIAGNTQMLRIVPVKICRVS